MDTPALADKQKLLTSSVWHSLPSRGLIVTDGKRESKESMLSAFLDDDDDDDDDGD